MNGTILQAKLMLSISTRYCFDQVENTPSRQVYIALFQECPRHLQYKIDFPRCTGVQ